jgi:hypothetical protein
MPPERSQRREPDVRVRHLARIVLTVFLLTFVAARIVVFLIMARRMPDLYLHLGGTHVHHLNYGIFLLSGVGAWLLFARPAGRPLELSAAIYAVGLALTFDEFGMWVHLGGSYWQRASYDAVVVISALLGLAAFAPTFRDWRPRHSIASVAVALASITFFALLVDSLSHAERRAEPGLERLEHGGPI